MQTSIGAFTVWLKKPAAAYELSVMPFNLSLVPASEKKSYSPKELRSINLVAIPWEEKNITAGDEIIISTKKYHKNMVPRQLL
jgi:hypothetical protein